MKRLGASAFASRPHAALGRCCLPGYVRVTPCEESPCEEGGPCGSPCCGWRRPPPLCAPDGRRWRGRAEGRTEGRTGKRGGAGTGGGQGVRRRKAAGRAGGQAHASKSNCRRGVEEGVTSTAGPVPLCRQAAIPGPGPGASSHVLGLPSPPPAQASAADKRTPRAAVAGGTQPHLAMMEMSKVRRMMDTKSM